MDSIDISEVSRIKDQTKIRDIIKNIFMENWEEVFIFDGINNTAISYKDFFKMMLNCRDIFDKIGIKKNDFVCLLMPNSIELAVIYLTSLIMQITAVPIDIYKGELEIHGILSQVRYKAIIHTEYNIQNLYENTYDFKELRRNHNENRNIDICELNIFDTIDYDSLFLITFTSGSTGVAKGVKHSFIDLFLSASAFNEKFNFGKRNIFYHNLPMTYMAGILNLIILPFISGSKIIIGERFSISNMAKFWDMPIKYAANSFWFIPTILALLLKLDRGNQGINYAHKVKIIGCVGTAPLGNKIKKSFENKYNIELYESYGLSETLFVTTNYPGMRKIENSVGKLLDGVEMAFCNDGEIAINTPWMFSGYTNVETNTFYKNGKYLSGDIGRIVENEFLTITGRKKDLIIRGGLNISPKTIEDFIENSNLFDDATVLGIEDMNFGEKIVCFFVPKAVEQAENKKKELNQEIIKKLGKDYKIDEFIKLNDLPRNNSGKIDKPKIREMYEEKWNVHKN